MQNGRNNERWLRPCDLCGSLAYEQVGTKGRPLHRCRECGLVQQAEEHERRSNVLPIDEGLFETALRQVTRRIDGVDNPSVLIIGRPPESSIPHVQESSLHITLLINPDEQNGLEGIATYIGSIANAPFSPEEFDVILSARGAESLDSPAALFAKARLWLAPGGLFFIGGVNWGSLTRHLQFGRWREYHRFDQVFADRQHLKEYAARYGFDLLSSGTRSRLEETMQMTFLHTTPTFLAIAGTLPFRILAAIPGFGERWWGLLCKRGYAVRPIVRKFEEETERAPGLAAAGYGNASREMIDAE